MQIISVLLFVVCFVASTYAGVIEKYGPLKAILYSDIITCDHNRTLDLDVSEVEVFFYDFANNVNLTFPIYEAAHRLNELYSLDITKRLIVFVPGYKSHISKKTEDKVRQTFQNLPDSYLIIIDHSIYTSARGGKVQSYERSVKYVYDIGKVLADFLSKLKSKGVPSKKIHCIGHSLGAQMLGHTGEIYYNTTGEKIWRITGLDPAGPCFSNSLIDEQIRSGVAEYVEVYHCNSGGLGTTSVLADADFFFNKGTSQPNCGKIPLFGSHDAAKCNHKACLEYWMATVKNPRSYLAWRCDSYKRFSESRCAGNEVTIAGFWNPGNTTGTFYASTDGYE